MADTSRAEVLTYLENANMMEISELIGEIEEKFGVTAAAPVAAVAAAPADGGGAAAEEKEEFDVEFIEHARLDAKLNDQRFLIKNEINMFFGSQIKEQKSYEKLY